jgi:hypothetical protein
VLIKGRASEVLNLAQDAERVEAFGSSAVQTEDPYLGGIHVGDLSNC